MGRPEHGEPDARARERVGSEIAPGLRLDRLLGVGDLGAVYATDGHSRGRIAVKVFHPDLSTHISRELLRSLEQAAQVGHPRAVAPLEVLKLADGYAIATRLIGGESAAALHARRRGRIPPSEALRISCDALELIGTAHAHGVCHGALSLSHLLLDDAGSTHLLGFGEARLRAELGLVPERSFTAPWHDPRTPNEGADLWAIAALLFVLSSGVFPRDNAGKQRSLASVTKHAPDALIQLTERAMSTQPERRFRDAGTMLAAFRQVAHTHEVQYAHPLGSALAAESGSHAWFDPARVTQPPPMDPGWSSTPPASPHLTPPSRPASLPPETPRSRLVPTLPPAPDAPAISEKPPALEVDVDTASLRGTTPPSGVAPAPKDPARHRPALPAEQDPLACHDGADRDALSAERDRLVALSAFDSALSLEEAWKAARSSPASTERFQDVVAGVTRALAGDDDGVSDLALELAALRAPDPERLVHVTASSLEGPALGPTLEAFGPALREHVQSTLEHEPHTTLRLLRMLHDRVRAPKSMLAAERSRVLEAVAVPGVMRALYARLGAHVSDAHALESLTSLLPALGPTFAAELAVALPQISDMSLQAQVLHHLEAELSGHEASLGELAKTSDARLGIEIARILSRIDTLAARDALAMAAESHHAVVRIEALGLGEGASGERLRRELKARLEEASGTARIQTLRALADHEVRVAAPFLALRLRASSFDSLPFEERRSLFHALSVLAPARAESVAIELLGHKKLLSTGAHEETRALAASTLGEIASSQEALDALAHHAERHFGTSDRVRHAALSAAEAVRARLASPAREAHAPERRRR
ncbi:MAG: hypothetical protein IPM35_14305 [Myxococcales bacterium]|nr:hypothetical protein [Myxococcales bacterium]